MPKTWSQKYNNGQPPHIDILDKPFGGLTPGQKLLISSPEEIDAYVRTIPRGETQSIASMRQELAKRHSADGTCPLTSGIFLRIISELALEELGTGKSVTEISPFWRMIEPTSPLAEKLSCGPEFIVKQRLAEA